MGTPAAQTDGTVVGLVPMAFVGRTSTATAQDPVASLRKQMRRAEERLPEGFYIARWYWDIESGGTDLDLRSRTDVWQQFTAAGIPRDGGMAQLRQAISSGMENRASVINATHTNQRRRRGGTDACCAGRTCVLMREYQIEPNRIQTEA